MTYMDQFLEEQRRDAEREARREARYRRENTFAAPVYYAPKPRRLGATSRVFIGLAFCVSFAWWALL